MSKGKNKKGGVQWQALVFYDSESSGSGSTYTIADCDLVETLERLCELSEEIYAVTTYITPLSKWQVTKFLLHHEFALFETNKWWWTIEKDGEGIHIQRSKDIENVRDKFNRGTRSQVGVCHRRVKKSAAKQRPLPRYAIWSSGSGQRTNWSKSITLWRTTVRIWQVECTGTLRHRQQRVLVDYNEM